MLYAALNIGDAPGGVTLVPNSVEHFRGGPKLHDEVAGQVLRLSLAPFLLPEADKGRFVAAHDDPGVGAADEGAAAFVRLCPHVRSHDFLRFKKWGLFRLEKSGWSHMGLLEPYGLPRVKGR